MKKFLSISCGILAVLAISVSCNKVSTDTPSGSNTPDTPSSEKITITATLSDALTKVREKLVTSGNHLNAANNKLDAVSIKIEDKSAVASAVSHHSFVDYIFSDFLPVFIF